MINTNFSSSRISPSNSGILGKLNSSSTSSISDDRVRKINIANNAFKQLQQPAATSNKRSGTLKKRFVSTKLNKAPQNTIPDDLWRKFKDAVKSHDRDGVAFLLENGLDVNLRHKKSRSTLLIVAAKYGTTDIVELILNKDAKINLMNSKRAWRPLMYASVAGRRDIVELLLSRGADLNLKDKDNNAPIFFAILKNDIELFDILLKYNPDLNLVGRCGYTPLQYAKKKQRAEIVEKLLALSANENIIYRDVQIKSEAPTFVNNKESNISHNNFNLEISIKEEELFYNNIRGVLQNDANETAARKISKKRSRPFKADAKSARKDRVQTKSYDISSRVLNIDSLEIDIVNYKNIYIDNEEITGINDEKIDFFYTNFTPQIPIEEAKNENLPGSSINEDQIDPFLFDNFDFLAEEFKKRYTFDLLPNTKGDAI